MSEERWVDREFGTVEVAVPGGEPFRVKLFTEGLHVTSLVNAGKRGKTVDTLHVDGFRADAGEWANFLVRLDEIVVTAAFIESVDNLAAEHHFETSISTSKGVHVKPAGVEPVVLGNDDFSFSFDPIDGFSGADYTDRNNEPRYISCSRTGARGIVRAYKLAKAGAFDACKTMNAALRVLRDSGIAGHYYCAMD